VRYGNVVGSRGSVVPIFQEQKKDGIITLTDERMTRFWITIDQAVHFSIQCTEIMKGGEVFVPIIPSMRVLDLADVIAPEAEKKFVGIRPSEKLHEVLLTEEEARHAKRHDNEYFLIEPEMSFRVADKWDEGTSLPDGFQYTSNGNTQWLTKSDLERMIKEL
jgi:FlaA1/EpsC-like NDP-sugar epimerase